MPSMLRLPALALALVAAAAPSPGAARERAPSGDSALVLEGVPTRVRWTDGDSFRVTSGPAKGAQARLAGVNALESFGPVHRWGAWTAEGLLGIAREARRAAAAGRWTCTAEGERDRYGRLLVACPDAALALVRAGLALAFAVDGPPDRALVEAQRDAQARRAGMWARGIAPLVPTSVHSADEGDLDARGAYDRVADTWTGRAEPRPHGHAYATCEEVCYGRGDARACMTYVPFERRYRNRPACLREGGGARGGRRGADAGQGARAEPERP
jgi:endonuclease YncB( thermonuclease family)